MPKPPLPGTYNYRRHLAIAAAVATLWLPGKAFAQATLPPGAVDLTPDARESLQNVTVNDSPEARKDIDTARGMERQKEWAKAAGWYQEVLEKYRRRVVAWKEDPFHVINRYRGIVFQVRESLAKWPPEGIAAYRLRYESTAAQLLAAAGPDDFNTLNNLIEAYFVTDAGKQAGLRLIDLHLEAGEFDAAARVGELLLDWYPQDQLVAERPRVLFRTALAHHLCGDAKLADKRAAELREKFPTATGQIFGKDAALADALDTLLKQQPKLAHASGSDAWPMFGGSPDRSHVSAAQGRMGAKVFGIDLPKRQFKGPNQVAERNAAQREEDDGRTLGIMPVVDGGAMYFQDGAHVWAVNIDSGLPLPGWAQTYGGGDSRGVYSLKNAQPTRTTQTTVTLSDTSVYAVMGQTNRLAMFYAAQGMDIGAAGGPDTGTRLICLDKATGKERWRVSMTALDPSVKDDERERLKALDFSGSPVVVGDNCYTLARGGKDVQFENCYVVCFDANTGQYRWSSLVASANTPFVAYGGDQMPPTNTLSHLAYASGRLYALTNLGALASVDAYNGAVVWLSIYPRDVNGNANEGAQFNNWAFRVRQGVGVNVRTWEFNPVLVRDGKVFIAPTDGKLVLVYDAATGEELKRINLEDFEHPNALVAVVNDRILMTGRRTVYAIDWAKYDNQKALEENVSDEHIWVALAPSGRQADAQDTIRGRAFVTGDSVFVPTTTSLYRMSLAKQLKIAKDGGIYPQGREWDEQEGPGNVVVSGEHVILAGSRSVDVYTDMALARAKLDHAVAAAPTDVDPRLHYAEVMFAAGQTPVSLEKMREAIGLLGGLDAMQPGPNRQRVFNDALTFAQKLRDHKQGDANEAAIEFFALAAKAAEAPQEQVSYRLSRAKFLQRNITKNSFATAIELYQEILQNPDWRAVGVMPDEDAAAGPGNGPTTGMQAGARAEREIAAVQAAHPEAYAEVERRAVAAMDAAKANGKADELLAVAQRYPNAAVAPQAMLAAAEAYEREGDARQATHVLRQIYRRYGNTADKGLILESMARNYLTLPGGLDVALARLQRSPNFSDTRLTKPLKLPDGTTVDAGTQFKQAVEQMRKAQAAAPGQPVADVHVPFARDLSDDERDAGKKPEGPFRGSADDAAASAAFAIDDAAEIVLPPAEWYDSPRVNVGARYDRLVAMIGDKLTLFAAGSPKPLGTCDKLTDVARNAVWSKASDKSPSRLIAWSNNEIVAMDDRGGTTWAAPLKAVPAGDLIAATGGLQTADVANDSVADNGNGDEQIVMGRGGRIIFRGGRRQAAARIMQLQQQQQIVADQNQADKAAAGVATAAPGPQEILTIVNPLGDRVIAGTSNGRVLCLNAADGKLLWQTRVSPKAVQRLIANEDFTALRVTEDNTVRLIVLDNYAGQVLMVRNFAMESSIIPVNMALSPDGMLVWTLPDRLCGKDLYEPGVALKYEFPPNRNDANMNNGGAVINPLYVGCNKAGQLVIAGSRVLTVEQSGRFVSIHSLEDGTIQKHNDGNDLRLSMLSTGAPNNSNVRPNTGDVNIFVTVSGPYAYLMGPQSLIAYHLERPATAQWSAGLDQYPSPNLRTLLPTKDFIIAAAEPGVKRGDGGAGNAVPVYRLNFFRRSPSPDDPASENGRFDYIYDIADPTGIAQWQVADGGVYYLTGEHKLRFLAGRRGS